MGVSTFAMLAFAAVMVSHVADIERPGREVADRSMHLSIPCPIFQDVLL